MNEDTNQCDNGKSFRINGNVLFAGAIILIIVTVFVTFLVAALAVVVFLGIVLPPFNICIDNTYFHF